MDSLYYVIFLIKIIQKKRKFKVLGEDKTEIGIKRKTLFKKSSLR